MKFNLDKEKTKKFNAIISKISQLIGEANMKFTENGLELVNMDPANVAMLIFKIPKSTFDVYDFDKETEVGINFLNLSKLLKHMKNLEMEFDDKITIKSTTKKFTLPIIAIDQTTQKIPELQPKSSFTIKEKDFTDGIEDIKLISESIIISAKNNKIMFKGNSDLSTGEINVETTNTKGDANCKYSIDYINKLVGFKLNENVNVSFDKDYPLIIEQQDEDFKVKCILAPRVDND